MQETKREEESRTRWKPVSWGMEHAKPKDQPRAFCRALEFLLGRINAMRVDAANARLRRIAPVIKDHGVEYEQSKFANKLRDGSITLDKTKAWIAKTVEREVASSEVNLQELRCGRGPALLHVHTAGMLDLVADHNPVAKPETLSLDEYRLNMLHAEFHYIALAAAMLATIDHSLSNTRTDPKVLSTVSDMFVLGNAREMNFDKAVADVCSVLQTADASPEIVQEINRALVQCTNDKNPVNMLMFKRNRATWLRLMKNPGAAADMKIPTAVKPLLPRIEKAVTCLRTITKLNCQVHMLHYNRMIPEAAHKLAEGMPTVEEMPTGEEMPIDTPNVGI